MKINHATLEDLTAQLAEAAVPVAMRHGVGERWLDMELDLWRVLTATIERWRDARVANLKGKVSAS
ncbi:MAG TPA: hypothetical protein VL371_19865 [Gemmataceae bacterium]|jgi:hypothetical protein|nr:hypothetical protein [Gemmataceae bacterium]